MDKKKTPLTHHYFVDEAGDLNLFNKKGQVLLGKEGVSYFFMVGVALLPNLAEAQRQLEELRRKLLADPYFQGVPSFQPEQKKTALAFHAKNDLPDDMVMRLFKNLLHKADRNEIVFARRGTSPRYAALQQAIERAKQNFAAKWGNPGDTPTAINSAFPHQQVGLQVVDYYLWALQRFYERREDRYFNLLAKDFRLIMDLDDKRYKPYGSWYSDSNPLTLDKLAWSFHKAKK
ncbi:MAG: hypothetical protein B6243_12055 [Anaerolineaceae bacterium 4572_5.2]|nr:MAG: hypothetical protein B6243_12055 [Anaerolineaceae bacterium 4572_5.2]